MLAVLPGLFWTAASCASPAVAAPLTEGQLKGRIQLVAPGIDRKVNVASATTAPWVDANGWRFRRNPAGEFVYDLPAGPSALAAAEAFAYGANAVLKIDAGDLPVLEQMVRFLAGVPKTSLPEIADFGFIDDGSDDAAEILNLLTRRNLLYRIVPSSDPHLRLTVAANADNPQLFAAKIREKLGDDERSLRVYGSETVLCRLLGDGSRARVHILSYGQREIDGVRLRVRGSYTKARLYAPVASAQPAGLTVDGGFTEFSVPKIGTYAVVDLSN
jgi:hypothetical protein